MKQYIYFISLLLLISCSDASRTEIDSANIEETFLFDLKENLDFVGTIKDVAISSDSVVAVVSKNPTRLYLYTFDGQQFNVVEGGTDGKNDFSNPSIVRYHGDYFYVWGADKHRFFVYDTKGNIVNNIKGPSYAIGDFAIKDNMAYCYISGGFSHWVSIYDLVEERLIKDLGATTNEQLLLDRSASSGGITLFNSEVLVSPSSELKVVSVDVSHKLKDERKILDENFTVDSVLTDPYQMVSSDIQQLIDYLHQNSYVNGLFHIGDTLVLKAETGFLSKDDANILGNSNRFENYYLLNKNFDFLKSYIVPHTFYVSGLFFSNSKNLYRLHMQEGENNFIYKVYRMEFK